MGTERSKAEVKGLDQESRKESEQMNRRFRKEDKDYG